MRIRRFRLLAYRLPFRQAWRTHRSNLQTRRGWIVELITADGMRGYGDCAPLPSAGTETAGRAHQRLQEQLPTLRGRPLTCALESLTAMQTTPAARHALETALLDLLSRQAGVALRHWLEPRARDRVPVNGVAGALDEATPARCRALLQQGFEILKLKLGLQAPAAEVMKLRQLHHRLPAHARLRLDANGAWSLAEAQRFLHGIETLPIESLEEPLAQPRLERLAQLQGGTHIALALDESLPRLPLAQLLEQPPVRRLILKPPVLGGLTRCLELARQAARAGIECVVTSTLESALGLQAAAQLAAALPESGEPLAHGLATGDWFSRDLAQGPTIVRGWLRLSTAPGLGTCLKSDDD